MNLTRLVFGKGNAKLGNNIYTFSLPAGKCCPGANECLAKADRITGKITDGPNAKFRCFSASTEAIFPSVRKARWNNFELLAGKSQSSMVEIIQNNLPKKATIIRLHISGDFFNEIYFKAWMQVATNNPHIIFYAYTKSIHFWQKNKELIPVNVKLNASIGGKYDELIFKNKLKFVKVVYSPEQAKAENLEIDHDDSHAYKQNKSFGLLIHGNQSAGSFAGEAMKKLRKRGFKGYSNKNNKA